MQQRRCQRQAEKRLQQLQLTNRGNPALGQAAWYRTVFAGWMTPRFGPYVPSLAFAVVFLAFWWLVVWAMDRRGIYLKL